MSNVVGKNFDFKLGLYKALCWIREHIVFFFLVYSVQTWKEVSNCNGSAIHNALSTIHNALTKWKLERSGPVKCAPYLFGIMATDLIISSEINSRVYRFVYHSVEQKTIFLLILAIWLCLVVCHLSIGIVIINLKDVKLNFKSNNVRYLVGIMNR